MLSPLSETDARQTVRSVVGLGDHGLRAHDRSRPGHATASGGSCAAKGTRFAAPISAATRAPRERTGVSLRLPEGGSQGVDAFRRESNVEPANLPFNKLVVIESEGEDGQLELYLDGNNRLWNQTLFGVFTKLWGGGQGRLNALIAQMWQSSGGQPPPVAGADLGGG